MTGGITEFRQSELSGSRLQRRIDIHINRAHHDADREQEMKMKPMRWILLSVLLLSMQALAEEPVDEPRMEPLGDERYRIGSIIVDRNTQSFTIPGKILHLHDALEYVAVSREGMKGYESLFELDTVPGEFNLACILIGLDDAETVKPRFQFDDRKAEGPSVDITVSWEEDGETKSISAANAMKTGDDTYDDDSWVYIGSNTSPDGEQFMADVAGTLIGFVHDPDSIIEHRNGAGIGAYGLLTGNEGVLPEEGSPVTLTVSVPLQEAP